MDSIYLDKLLKDTKLIVSIERDADIDINKLEQVVSGIQPSPRFILIICEWATFLESFRFSTLQSNALERRRLYAKACYDTYLKNSNPMGFLIMLSKLLPALECPHTVLTTGPVKKRLVTKKAKLLLINFMASFVILLTEHWNSTEQSQLCKKNSFFDGIAHISGPEHTKKVVEKYNIEHLETFGYTVNKSTRTLTFTPTKKKMNQLREGVKNMYFQEKEQFVPSTSSGGRTVTPSRISRKRNTIFSVLHLPRFTLPMSLKAPRGAEVLHFPAAKRRPQLRMEPPEGRAKGAAEGGSAGTATPRRTC